MQADLHRVSSRGFGREVQLALLGVVSPSPLWLETSDDSGRGPDYINTVALLVTPGTDPAALLEDMLRAELRLGRDRSQGRNAPRTLDLDLIAVKGMEGRWRWPTPPRTWRCWGRN